VLWWGWSDRRVCEFDGHTKPKKVNCKLPLVRGKSMFFLIKTTDSYAQTAFCSTLTPPPIYGPFFQDFIISHS